MSNALKNLSKWAYLAGALLSAIAILALPFSHDTVFWDINLQITMVAVGIIFANALISATGLLSKNFPAHFLLVVGTALLVSTLALMVGSNAFLTIVQQASVGLLIIFVVCRLVIEFVLNKTIEH